MESMEALDMMLANEGNVPTCVRTQGESVVDLVWITADLREKVQGWRVMDEE